MIAQVKRFGWLAVEAAFLLVVLCILLNVILGEGSGAFIASVAANAIRLLQAIPPGTVIGLVVLVVFYGFIKARLSK